MLILTVTYCIYSCRKSLQSNKSINFSQIKDAMKSRKQKKHPVEIHKLFLKIEYKHI